MNASLPVSLLPWTHPPTNPPSAIGLQVLGTTMLQWVLARQQQPADAGVFVSLVALVCAVGVSYVTAAGLVQFQRVVRESADTGGDAPGSGPVLPIDTRGLQKRASTGPVHVLECVVQLNMWNALLAVLVVAWDFELQLRVGPFHNFSALALMVVLSSATSEVMVGLALRRLSVVALVVLVEALDAGVNAGFCFLSPPGSVLNDQCGSVSHLAALACVLAGTALLVGGCVRCQGSGAAASGDRTAGSRAAPVRRASVARGWGWLGQLLLEEDADSGGTAPQ